MKRLKQKQLGPWCSYCGRKTSRAIYRQDGFAGKFCCHKHRADLIQKEIDDLLLEDRRTEADYQTWEQV